jgi:hypothetical protein
LPLAVKNQIQVASPKVVNGNGFGYWGNRPTKTPIPLLTDAGASTVAIIT